MINVLVNGAMGRMGQECVKAITADAELDLVAENDVSSENQWGGDLQSAISSSKAEVVVDFTVPSVAFENVKTIIESGARPVVGTTGLTPEQIEELKGLCAERNLGGLIAPNFAVGAVLMMKFAQEAAKYLPQVEIIELHHDKKEDSPSGTAIKTSEMIAEHRGNYTLPPVGKELVPGARGATNLDIPIHSVRLPGLVAHQEVLFGGTGETLSIRHDSISRESFMPGVCLACKKVMSLDKLIYGLENILT